MPIHEILDQLETHYGLQTPSWPTDAYHFLIWWHCGYPASDSNCNKGWQALTRDVGVEVSQIIAAGTPRLTMALKAGGMVPEIRAMRLLEIATRIQNEYSGDLHTALSGPLKKIRLILKRFPGIADPGADRILLFAGIQPIAAIPSNCPHVLVRIQRGQEHENYGVTYAEAQQAIEAEVPNLFDPRVRAFLLIKQHGQTLCKRTNPKCAECPISSSCAYFAGKNRGRPRSS